MSHVTVESIAARIVEIGLLDPDRAQFGAERHGHAQNPPADEAALAAFERTHGLRLPADYRAYLARVADGGAGPFYGLYDLATAAAEGAAYAGEVDDPLAPFPVDAAGLAAFVAHRRACLDEGDDDEIVYPPRPEPCPGLLFLCEYGCGGFYALVARGELAGTVWFVDDAQVIPVLDGDRPQAFLAWMGDAVDAQLDALRPGSCPPRPAAVSASYSCDGCSDMVALPPDALANPHLKKLVLSRTELAEFPTEILALRELRTLDLSMTGITALPAAIGTLRALRKLRFNYNDWTDLPDELAQLDQLVELSIFYGSTVEALPAAIARLPRLRKLLVSHCARLATLPEAFGDLTTLEHLTLNDTALTALPASFGDLAALQVLTLGATKLQSLPASFARLRSLATLDLGVGSLDLDQAIDLVAELPNLHTLTLPMAARWPASVARLASVRRLRVAPNWPLYHAGQQRLPVPEALGLFPRLEELDLTNTNQADGLPVSLGALTNLRTLRVAATAIRDLPDAARDLPIVELHASQSRDPAKPYGFTAEVRAKLAGWYPSARLAIF